MAKENEIVTQINADLVTNQFSADCFGNSLFAGIAEPILMQDDQTLPGIVDNDGEVTKLFVDDNYDLIMYHRHTGHGFVDDFTTQSFGDRVAKHTTASMRLVVYFDKNRLNISREDIITGIELGMTVELGSAFLTTNTLQSAVIEPGTFDLDRQAVWAAEFATTEFFLKPEQVLFAYNYNIVTDVSDACIAICN